MSIIVVMSGLCLNDDCAVDVICVNQLSWLDSGSSQSVDYPLISVRAGTIP